MSREILRRLTLLDMELNAGPVRLQYENGFVRTFTANGEEVLRMIYFAARDRRWNTARITIHNEQVTSNSDSFSISYDWRIDDRGISLNGMNQIAGHADGTITFDFRAEALNTFYRNRLGFCVLHPIDGLAGQACMLENPGGQTSTGTFPDLIAPYQPLLDIRVLHWQMASGQRFVVAFEGDVFETEDQRNWSDASYKTYCTPLSRPIPVEVTTGTVIQQRVTFRPALLQKPMQPLRQPPSTDDAEPDPLRIGLGYRPDGPSLSADEAQRLKALNLSHLRADVYLNSSGWEAHLAAARRDADALAVPLEVALFFGQDTQQEIHSFVTFAQERDFPIRSLLLFEADSRLTTDKLLAEVVPALRQQLPDVSLGGGTDAYFVDLNRNRFSVDAVDFVTYSVNPQVHAFDDQTMLENTAAQADTVRSARVIAGGKPVHLSPVTLLPRYNPDDTGNVKTQIPPADDRQSTSFAAEWTRRSLEALSRAGAASVTYFETHGPRGLLDGDVIFPVLAAIDQYQKSARPSAPD